MNERATVERINAKHRVAVGSTPRECTPIQYKAACVCGRLMHHAKKRGKRHKAKWVDTQRIITP